MMERFWSGVFTAGAVEVPRRQYHKLLEAALVGEGDFGALGMKRPVSGAQALAKLTTDW
jgi:leucyl/phenylalanyl-tRNA--protein transferase